MIYDVAIIGGGPAGLMAAGRAAELGARVLLLEKNNSAGVKLLITGKERCNISNNTLDPREMIKIYGDNGKFLYSALFKFGVQDVIDFFNDLGVTTKVERGNRIFPVSDRSRDVLDALIRNAQSKSVEIKTNASVKDIVASEDRIGYLKLYNGQKIEAKQFIVACGGKSYPSTGSSGEAYLWLEKLGHHIVTPRPALTPIICREKYISELEGLSLRNVEISLYKNKEKQISFFGEAIFTSRGMSGPVILNISKYIREEEASKYRLSINFKPALDPERLDKRLINDFKIYNNKNFKNSLDALLPKKLIPLFVKLSEIDPEKKVNLITKAERARLAKLLSDFSLEVAGLVGFDKAIVTNGGVDLKEIDPKTMRSKKINNLFLAGEILDIDGPTGGYNLQVCWSTGYTAGEYASQEANKT